MKKKYIIFVLVLVAALSGCAKVIIPEISPNLSHKELLNLTGKEIANVMLENNSQLVFINLEGEFFRWDPQEKMVNSLVHINSQIDPTVFSQGDYVVFKQLKNGKYSVFDLKEMKEIASLENNSIREIIGINNDLLVYLAKPNRLTIYDYRKHLTVKSLKVPRKMDFYNVEFRGDKVFILSSDDFYTYSRGLDAFTKKELKHKAVSGFLLDGDAAYYGSADREMVKVSIRSFKPLWSFRLAEQLTLKPQKIDKYVVIIPEDNNIYFFKKSGTLFWWEKLNSTRLHTPAIMGENVAVYLWDKNIKFFNYKKKQVTTYPLGYRLRTDPAPIGEYLYAVTEEKLDDEEIEDEGIVFLNLVKLGNHYGIDITTNPRYVKPLGKSVRFDIKSINLIKPHYTIEIFKNLPGEINPIYEKSLSITDKPSFVWIPKEAIEYRMIIKIESENIKYLTVEKIFPALDIQKILRDYYYELQSQCESNTLN